jgi:hypothetical protein
MPGQGPIEDRVLVWQVTTKGEGFACSRCSWSYPNPQKLTEREHDAAQVQRRFDEHICNRELPLKKFNWG